MKRVTLIIAGLALAFSLVGVQSAAAGGKSSASGLSEHPNSRYYRGTGPHVRGFRKRVGGYSYSHNDSIIAYQDDTLYRDPEIVRQSAPFDSGFFFESNIMPHNNSPYP